MEENCCLSYFTKQNEIAAAMAKLVCETRDTQTLMEMALKEMVSHEKRLNDLADASEGKINLLSQYAKTKGIIYLHSRKVGGVLVDPAYKHNILTAKSDAGWNLPIAVQKPQVKLGPQAAAVEEDQIILISDDKNVKQFVTDAHPSLVVGVDAFFYLVIKVVQLKTDHTGVDTNEQKEYGG